MHAKDLLLAALGALGGFLMKSPDLPQPAPDEPMSRKDRYLALYPFYVEENDRYEALNKRAAAYLTVLGGLAVFATFKLDSVAAKILADLPTLLLGLATGVASIGAVVFIAWSMRISDYQTIVDVEELVLKADKAHYTSEDVYSELLGGLAESVTINHRINDDRAGRLEIALWFAVAAALFALLTNLSIFRLIKSGVTDGDQTCCQRATERAAASAASAESAADQRFHRNR